MIDPMLLAALQEQRATIRRNAEREMVRPLIDLADAKGRMQAALNDDAEAPELLFAAGELVAKYEAALGTAMSLLGIVQQ